MVYIIIHVDVARVHDVIRAHPTILTDPPEERPVQQKLEDKRRGDLVGQVGDTEVKVRQVQFEDVSHHHL